MVNILGVEFAPLDVPLHRRLETFFCFLHILIFTFWPLIFGSILVSLLFTPCWFITLGYMIWWIYHNFIVQAPVRGGCRSEWLRNGYQSQYFRDYFPVSLIKTADLDPQKNYIMGYHPHGIVPAGAFGNFASNATGFNEKYPGMRSHLMTLKINLRFPILREYLLWMGLCDVSRDSIKYMMTQNGTGNVIVIVVGGAEEALEAHPGTYNVVLKRRKGFIKIALQTGASLVPTYTFGENNLYSQAPNPLGSKLRKFQEWAKEKTGYGLPLFHGRGIFNYTLGIMPYRKPVTTVVGSPIDVLINPNPTTEDIEDLHQKYITGLRALFDRHKTKYGANAHDMLTVL